MAIQNKPDIKFVDMSKPTQSLLKPQQWNSIINLVKAWAIKPDIKQVDISKPVKPLVVNPNATKTPPKGVVSAPIAQPKANKADMIQMMLIKQPKWKEALDSWKVNENDIFNAAIKKYPKIKAAVLNWEVELNTVDNKWVVAEPSIWWWLKKLVWASTIQEWLQWLSEAVEKPLWVVAWASKWALDYLNKANIAVKEVTSLWRYDASTDPMQQAYNNGSQIVFDKAKANNEWSFWAWEVWGKALASMALIPWLWPIKWAWVAKNVIAWALEWAASTQLNSYIDTGKAASLKDTGIWAAFWWASMWILRKLQKWGSLKQTKDLIIPKQTAAEEILRSEAGLRKRSFWWWAYKPLANKQEAEAAKELQTILRPNKWVQQNADIMTKAIEKESTSMRKLVEKTPLVDKSKEALDMNLQTFRKKVLDKFIWPTTRKADIATEAREYKKVLKVINNWWTNSQIKRSIDWYNKVLAKVSPDTVNNNIKLAEKLKSMVVRWWDKVIYDIKNTVDKIDVPRSVKSDTTILNKWNNIKDEYLDILSSNKNKWLAWILDSRQELDRIINRDYPNLYTDDANAPLREMVSKLRSTSNEIINKATNWATKESLRKQTLYYSVRDKLNTKLEKTGETNMQRWSKENPRLNKFIDYTSRWLWYSALWAVWTYAWIKAVWGNKWWWE
jgi:hypothetical protein